MKCGLLPKPRLVPGQFAILDGAGTRGKYIHSSQLWSYRVGGSWLISEERGGGGEGERGGEWKGKAAGSGDNRQTMAQDAPKFSLS